MLRQHFIWFSLSILSLTATSYAGEVNEQAPFEKNLEDKAVSFSEKTDVQTYLPNYQRAALTKKRVLADLESIYQTFEVKYAPLKWKEEFSGWNLETALEDAKRKVNFLSSPSLKDCQIIVRDFFNSMRDYHVGVRFYSTETASLPFLVKSSGDRYFITFVDRKQVAKKKFPFEVGDEILSFGGRPIHEVVEEIRQTEYGSNTFETDSSLAEMTLTHRQGENGNRVPQGSLFITGKKKGASSIIKATLEWAYTPEKIMDFSKLGAKFEMTFDPLSKEAPNLRQSGFFDKFMVAHFWDKSFVGSFLEGNNHALGARSSFIPPLGSKVWNSGNDSIFDSYIFKHPNGQKIGYIRLPHYIGDEEEVDEFGILMNYFQQRTDALVIDQINNPGGSIFYLYGLAATLTDKPLFAPPHRISLTQEEVYTAVNMLPYLDQATNDKTARDVFGKTLGGYPVDYEFVKLTKQFCHFLIDQWNSGTLFSEPTHIFGVKEIKPHPQYRYTKPILLLVNSLDFSGGDFFPSIMQDNQRATLLGTRTSGAGGYVLNAEFPNHSGIKGYVLTGSLAQRKDLKPIENLGVLPDIPYELSVEDLQNGYKEYIGAILNAVENLLIEKQPGLL